MYQTIIIFLTLVTTFTLNTTKTPIGSVFKLNNINIKIKGIIIFMQTRYRCLKIRFVKD